MKLLIMPFSLNSFSFIYRWVYSSLLGPGLFFNFVIFFMQTVELLGRLISPSQGRYLHTEQHTHTNIHSLSGIRTHDPCVRASEESSCLRPRGPCDRLLQTPTKQKRKCKQYESCFYSNEINLQSLRTRCK
jgi:hypothetical protein